MERLINTIRRHITITDREVELVKNLFKIKLLNKRDLILQVGKVCKSLFFVSKGLLRQYMNYEGKELTLLFNEENTFACDYISFVSQTKSTKTIEALEETELYSISYNDLQKFYEVIRYGDRFGRLLLEEVFGSAIQNIISMQRDTDEERYVAFITSYHHLLDRIPQYHIASFIGVTPQSLSRIRRRLAKG